MIHPQFQLNNQSFASVDELISFAHLLKSESGEKHYISDFLLEWLNSRDYIEVRTSGSTGKPKTIRLQKKQVENSARATNHFFDLTEGTLALLCLSSQYIAGKMMLVRAMTGGWQVTAVEPESNPLKQFEHTFDFTAMVPLQVFHSIEDLYKVKKIIIGGGVIPSSLEDQLQQEKTLAFATYGMTETISHIAVRQINGKHKSSVYTALPDVRFSQTNEGCLIIDAPEISDRLQITNDVVDLISPVQFKFLGRLDNVVNSGGIKIYPEEVERKLSQFIQKPFFISSEEDEALGERLILIIENDIPVKKEDLFPAFEKLSSFEKPKKIYTLPKFIYTDTEKIKRTEILKLLKNV